MAHSARTIRIVSAALLAVLMVGAAYAFSGPTPWGRVVEAQSAEELLKAYAAKDTDTDGLPDWQEALYGTDPNNPESFQAGIQDGDAVAQGLVEPKVTVRAPDEPIDIDSVPGTAAAPSSLTERFSRAFISQYLKGRGETVPTPEEMNAFVRQGVADLVKEGESAPRYTASDVVRSGQSGTEALRAYAAAVDVAFETNTMPERKSELSYFEAAVAGDDAALTKIKAISDEYDTIARAYMKIPVPNEAVQAHLKTANALVHLSESSGDLAAMKTDPVRTLVGLSIHGTYANDLIAGFANLHEVFVARQLSIPAGMPGADALESAARAAQP